VLERDDDYSTAGKPVCDWEDKAAREALVDALARDAHAVLAVLDRRKLPGAVSEAAALLATVVGQDLERTEDGTFRIARRVATERVISTVDPQTRHGHKTAARGFDGYKGHIAVDPDAESITAATVTPGNAADGSVAKELLQEVLSPDAPRRDDPQQTADDAADSSQAAEGPKEAGPDAVEVYGDAAYGTAEILLHLEGAGAAANVKVQVPAGQEGRFSKDVFQVDLGADTVTCPSGQLVQIRRNKDGSGKALFGAACNQCPMAPSCTTSDKGRIIVVNKYEAELQRARSAQRETAWRARYKATRPKVERKLGHLMRRRHGGRRARVRGTERIAQDFSILCAAANLNRLANLGLHYDATAAGWRTGMPPTSPHGRAASPARLSAVRMMGSSRSTMPLFTNIRAPVVFVKAKASSTTTSPTP